MIYQDSSRTPQERAKDEANMGWELALFAEKFMKQMMAAGAFGGNQAAVAVIHESSPKTKAGITLSLHDIQAVPGGEENAAKEWDAEFLHYLPAIKDDDFLGVQNYTRSLIGPEGMLPNPEGAELTQSGYEYYPQALEHIIRAVAKNFHGEIVVTENGISTSDDERRIEFIKEATQGVANCIADGLPVKGYMYWSLLDNFEWQKGYAMTFGLVAVEPQV